MTQDRAHPARNAWTVALVAFLLAVWAHSVATASWTLLDDWILLQDELWPPDSPTNAMMRRLGREFSPTGLMYHVMHGLAGTNAAAHHAVSFLFFGGTVLLAHALVARLTDRPGLGFLAAVLVTTTSTAPELLLTIMKLEPKLSVFLLAAVWILARALAAAERGAPPGPAALAKLGAGVGVAVLLAGLFGKETVLLFPLALLVALVPIAFDRAFTGGRPRGPVSVVLVAVAACAVVLAMLVAWRTWLGVAQPWGSPYLTDVLDLRPEAPSALQLFQIYAFVVPDAVALCAIATALAGARLLTIPAWRWAPTTSTVVGVVCTAFATGHLLFFLAFVAAAQVYYLFPGSALALVAICVLAAEWRAAPRARWRAVVAVAVLGAMAYTVSVGAIRTYGRIAALRISQRHDLEAARFLATLPDDAPIFLWHPAYHEASGNLEAILRAHFGASPRFVRPIERHGEAGEPCTHAWYGSHFGGEHNGLFSGGRGTVPPTLEKVVAGLPEPHRSSAQLVYETEQSIRLPALRRSPGWPPVYWKREQWRFGWKVWRFACEAEAP